MRRHVRFEASHHGIVRPSPIGKIVQFTTMIIAYLPRYVSDK